MIDLLINLNVPNLETLAFKFEDLSNDIKNILLVLMKEGKFPKLRQLKL
jgi:hypothetical protein